MKKDKSKKEVPPQFNNNPFRSLKSFKPAPAATQQKSPALKRKENRDREDENELFLRAVSGARAIRSNAETEHQEKAAQPAPPISPAEDENLFLLTMKKMGTTLRPPDREEADEETPRQSASSRMKQLKRGTIAISEELDLHGFMRDEAIQKLRHFITGAYSRGRKAVLVITGKGINSSDGPVLQGAVAEWLRTYGKGLVTEFGPAPRDKGGSGAVVVFLKAKDR